MSKTNDPPNWIGMGAAAYGASPDPFGPPNRPNVTLPGTELLTEFTEYRSRKLNVAVRVDDDGKIWLRVSIDGVHVTEISGEGRSLTLTEDI